MQRAQARRRDRLEDGLPGELVAKRQAVALRLQHPEADARLGRLVDVLADLGQELGLDPRADDGGGLQQRPTRGGQAASPRQHRVADGGGNAAAAGREHLADEERIAAGLLVQGHRVDAAVGHERAHRLGGQRGERHTPDRAPAGEIAEHAPQRMAGAQLVVAIGQHEQGRQLLDAAPEELHEVERRLVGPVQVLHDHHGRARLVPEGVEDGGEDGRARDLGVEQRAQWPGQRLGDVSQRPQWARGEQGIARPPQHARRVTVQLGEALDERGLADAGLAADQHHASVPAGHLAESGAEGREHGLTLEKVHRRAPGRFYAVRHP